ncbi:MAG: site-specific integrase [Clostridiales bacterium]|nr:site-specific integrase [Clostridiales bacterium]
MAIKLLGKNKAQLIVSIGSASKGTRRRVTKTVTYTRKKDLEKMYRHFEDEVRRNPLTDATVDELLDAYISNAELRGLSANTIHGYKSAQNRLNSAFKGVLARSLTTYQLDGFIAEMAKKYKPKTVKNTIALLDAAYQRAVRSGQLADNPCVGITLPKQQKKEIKTLSPEQLTAFIEKLDEQRRDISVGYKLCLMCGLRRGEVLGLTEKDVNLLFRTVSVNKARYIVEGKEHIQETKTARSHRTLALPKVLADEIGLLIQEHHAQEWYHSDILIQDAFGDPISPSVFSGMIKSIDPDITVHGLRHSFATLLNAKDIDIAQMSAELGHSNLATTLNIYTHVFGDVASSSRSIADTIDSVFDKKGAKGAHEDKEKTLKAL